MNEQDRNQPTVEAPAAAAAAPTGGRRTRRLPARALVVIAAPFLLAFVVLAGHRDGDCVGRTGTAALEACRVSSAAVEPWLFLTGAGTLVLLSLAGVVRAAD
ncbi:hypothetical protein RAJCM14343_5233 [Rhodococcus aetherivorans]|uniref:Uncharacterized protein n=1 Tax=Rhodococcus aetherivorans TaxID=191292 RepID=A0ABQ0YTP8_9NOCA|nr:hypothetical protein [Rhodococcus aetherivorans]ETT27837.1 hypothetical protein RR21198_1550 [Rhodococcus rhodochrous ATCC 21198]NGP29803.1 hypothetical protein [Rhodococcus aetherivorans]GES39955.1 hypothetical protein RAJCM14343_5233 [Rhodococcus aetherivorans]